MFVRGKKRPPSTWPGGSRTGGGVDLEDLPEPAVLRKAPLSTAEGAEWCWEEDWPMSGTLGGRKECGSRRPSVSAELKVEVAQPITHRRATVWAPKRQPERRPDEQRGCLVERPIVAFRRPRSLHRDKGPLRAKGECVCAMQSYGLVYLSSTYM
jgi:hypothetical protein